MEKPPATDVIILLFVSENSLAQRKAVVYAITYHWEGDYLIPDLKLSDTTEYQIGKYGRMRQRFLKENHGGIYSYMILSETLWKHLAEIDEECNEMMDRLVSQMAKKEGVTEQLKSDDWLCWLQKMNSIRSRVEEVVLHDLIYSL